MEALEIRRQIFHACFGILLVLLIYFNVINWWILLSLIAIGLIISIFCRKTNMPIIRWFLRYFEREKDMKNFPGKGFLLYLIGSWIVLFFFEKDIALASIMILALGDSFSRLIGENIGRIKNPINKKKFIEGLFSGCIFGFFGAVFFVSALEAFLASLLAMAAEGIEIKFGLEKVDDNLIIPIVAAAAIFTLRAISL